MSTKKKGVWVLPRVCPDGECRGQLVKHGAYLRGACEDAVGVQFLWIPRLCCKACGRTMAVLPHFLAPYQRFVTDLRERVVTLWAWGPASGAWRMRPA